MKNFIRRHPRLFTLGVFASLILIVLADVCGGPYDQRYPGSKWGGAHTVYAQTIPMPTYEPTPGLVPEPVIPVIGVGGCNSNTPYFCSPHQLFMPAMAKGE